VLKTFHTCRVHLRKELSSASPVRHIGQTLSHSQCQGLLKFFPKRQFAAGNSQTFRLRSIASGSTLQANLHEMERISPKNVSEKRDIKFRFSPMLLIERRCNLAFSRRIFLRHGVLAAAACASNPFSAMAFGARRTPIGGNEDGDPQRAPVAGSDNWQDHAAALDHLGRNAFSGAIGSSFKVFTAAGQLPVWLTLLAVEDLPAIAPVNPASFAVPNKGS